VLAALEAVAEEAFDVLISDIGIPNEDGSLSFSTQVIIVTTQSELAVSEEWRSEIRSSPIAGDISLHVKTSVTPAMPLR